jgi:tetratricopeptide (TPR) repeat protein
MAKKKSKGPKKSPGRPARSKPRPPQETKLPDRRALEGIMKGLLGGLTGDRQDTPLDRAQELMYEAFDTSDPKKRIRLAERALEISPDCADAYVILADEAKSRKESLELLEKGVAAGERALGPETFRDSAGHFWGLLETRPYMRARERLAHHLWMAGQRDEAVGHLQEMLRLNPGDNQGLRYTLAEWLLIEGRDDDLANLIKQYDEDGSAAWDYTKALLEFRKSGDTPRSRELLKVARKTNKHVTPYLLGRKLVPMRLPEMYSLGGEDEAILYAANALSGWKSTPGAIDWLKQSEPGPKVRKAPKVKTQGPLPIVKKRLAKLPQEFDVWQADARPFGRRVEERGELIYPWIVVVISLTNGRVQAQTMSREEPTTDLLWDQLADAIQSPLMGKPHRPTEVQVRPGAPWDGLAPHLDEIGVGLVKIDRLEQIDSLLAELDKQMAADEPPGLLDVPGVRPDLLAGFYQAAAGFYRKAPWRKLGFEAVLRVDSDKFQSGPWFGVVMGQGGMTTGLALYDDLKTLKKLLSGRMSDEQNARETVALTVTFGNEMDIPDADLDAIKTYGFEVAGHEAYPSIFRKERGMSMRPPLAWELELMEGCLRAIPEFVSKHRPDDHSRNLVTVPVVSGPLKLELSWVDI